MAKQHMKRRPTHMLSGRCKGKQHGDTIPVRKAPVHSTGSTNAGGRAATGLSQCRGGRAKWGRHFGRQIGVFVKN